MQAAAQIPADEDGHVDCSLVQKIHPLIWLLAALSPVIVWYVKRLDDGSDEPLGLLTLTFGMALVWRDRTSFVASVEARVCGAMLVWASVISIIWLPPMLRAGLAVSGAAVFFGVHRRAGLIGLLLLSLPVVASLQFYAGYPLRIAAAEGTVRLLEMGNVVVSRTGAQMEIGGRVVGVDPACSGVRMLWHALVAAMALAALHRTSWCTTVTMALLAILLVIPANTLRAFFLVFEQTGFWEKSDLLHGAIGLGSFAIMLGPLWWIASKRAGVTQSSSAVVSAPLTRFVRLLLICPAVLGPLLAMTLPRTPLQSEIGPDPLVFTFDGLTLPLSPMSSTEAELAFAKSFPGTLSSHRWGGQQVILRRMTGATRRLHPSRDCLRAAGFHTSEAITVTRPDGSEWASFSAERGGEWLRIFERIVSERDGTHWTDVSAWYWSAMRRPLNGPWRAETVISRR